MVVRLPRASELSLSVQETANRHHSIVRGQTIPGTPFCGEYAVDLAGVPVVGSHIRDDTLAWGEHLARAEERNGGRKATGFFGAGNLTMNPEYVGFSRGTLYCVDGQRFDRLFPSLVFDGEGVSFQRARLDPSSVPSEKDGLSGPQLVSDGKPVDFATLVSMAQEGYFYDLRHVLQFPSIFWPEEEGLSIDIGLERFWKGGELDRAAVGSALRGEVLEVNLRSYTDPAPRYGKAFGISLLRDVLTSQGYAEARPPQSPGEFQLGEDETLRIRFFPGIYNHSLLGVDSARDLVWLGMVGLGNRVGLTMLDTARLASDLMTNAILVDNGGDVMCWLDRRWVLPSSYGRERTRGLVLLHGDPARASVQREDLPIRPLGDLRGSHGAA